MLIFAHKPPSFWADFCYQSQREVKRMSFQNKNQCIHCDVTSCKHHASDGMCSLDSIKVAPRENCHNGSCDESECSNYSR